jgi:membrane protein implicated in regulation of membrane protease activity
MGHRTVRAIVSAMTALAMLLARAGAAAEAGGWHELPGFDFGLGIVGCAAIVWISKWLGRRFLQRPESYYDGESP